TFLSCKQNITEAKAVHSNTIAYASGLEIHNYDDFTVMKITKPWPSAVTSYTYVCAKSKEVVPDSLKRNTFIKIPVETMVASSTTHISALEALEQTDKLIGFPNLDYISSGIVR